MLVNLQLGYVVETQTTAPSQFTKNIKLRRCKKNIKWAQAHFSTTQLLFSSSTDPIKTNLYFERFSL